MKVSDLLDKRSIDVNASPKSKKEAIETATDLIAACGAIRDREAFRSLVFARETAVPRESENASPFLTEKENV